MRRKGPVIIYQVGGGGGGGLDKNWGVMSLFGKLLGRSYILFVIDWGGQMLETQNKK